MLNAIQKLHALMVSTEIDIWHFPLKTEQPRFYYWLLSEPDNREGHAFCTLEGMIDAAYACIDPLAKPFPEAVEMPVQAREVV